MAEKTPVLRDAGLTVRASRPKWQSALVTDWNIWRAMFGKSFPV